MRFNPAMRYRRLGKTGLMVSEIGFGAEWLAGKDESFACELTQACHDAGINLVDCWMADPSVRSNLGAAIAQAGGRAEWFIQGHIGSTWQDGQYVRTRDIGPVRAAFADELERLRTDYFDLGMVHFVDSDADWEASTSGAFWEFVNELLDAGTIRHLGISTHNPRIAKKAIEHGAFEMIMFSINPAFDMLPPNDDINVLFADEYDEALGGINRERSELYQLAEAHDIGMTVMKPFAGGRLFDAQRSPFGVALTPAQCIHYCLTRPAVASVLGGYSSVEHVREAVSYETAPEEACDYATVLASAPRHTYAGQCTYCGHCSPCTVGIDIAMVNKYADLAALHDEIPASVKDHYEALDVHAGECTGCQACEDRCPFGVPIAQRMAETAELFGGR